MRVVYNDITYECAIAYRGSDCVRLVDSSGLVTADFRGVVNFALFTFPDEDGGFTDLPDAPTCDLSAIRPDGTIIPSGVKACQVATKNVFLVFATTNEVSTVTLGGKEYYACSVPYTNTMNVDTNSDVSLKAFIESSYYPILQPMYVVYDKPVTDGETEDSFVLVKYYRDHYVCTFENGEGTGIVIYFDAAPPFDGPASLAYSFVGLCASHV